MAGHLKQRASNLPSISAETNALGVQISSKLSLRSEITMVCVYIYPLVYTLESIFLEITMVWGFYHWDLRLHSSDLRSRCGSVLPAWPSAAALVSRALGAQFAQGQRKDRAVISHSVQGLNLFWTRNYAHSMCNVVSKKGIVFQKMIMIMLSNIYILSCFMGCIIIYYNHP